MEPLVLAAGTALVSAMATDAWQQARASAVALWRRVHPERVPTIEAELTEVRDEVLAARAEGDTTAEEGITADWQRKLRRLVQNDPALGQELQRVLDEELTPLLPRDESPRSGTITMQATASGNGRNYQVGQGNLTINEK
ncbi:hypothetical protein [Streptomyces sp. NPDC093707]|uniref:hypothetical protein n=1 Tax=Streptomyces sp. NPDC093707 TaxID=3154984 RepID=UPI00344B1C01